jgi:hypothetical protein
MGRGVWRPFTSSARGGGKMVVMEFADALQKLTPFLIDVVREPENHAFRITMTDSAGHKVHQTVSSLELKKAGNDEAAFCQAIVQNMEAGMAALRGQKETERERQERETREVKKALEQDAKKQAKKTFAEELKQLEKDFGEFAYGRGFYKDYQGYEYKPIGTTPPPKSPPKDAARGGITYKDLERSTEASWKAQKFEVQYDSFDAAMMDAMQQAWQQAKGEQEVPPKKKLTPELKKMIDANTILKVRNPSANFTLVVFIEPPAVRLGVAPITSTFSEGETSYSGLSYLMKAAIMNGWTWIWDPARRTTLESNIFGDWLLDMKAPKNNDETNTTIANLYLEWWREKGLAVA